MGQGSSTSAVEVYKHRWTIKNFVYCGEQMQSDVFSSAGGRFKWRMELDPNVPTENGTWVSLHVRLVECDRAAVRAMINFEIYQWRSNSFRETVYTRESNGHVCLKAGQAWGFEQFILHSSMKLKLNCGDLKICCSVSVSNGPWTDSTNEVTVPQRCLSTDVAQLFNSDELTDCTLVAGEREFKAHKVLLSVRSPVFAAMFRRQMQESETNRVPIDDIRPAVVHQMLSFIYTENAPDLGSMADELLAAADKYQVKSSQVLLALGYKSSPTLLLRSTRDQQMT